MDTIISKSNEKVKFIKNLNEKKFRQKYNAFYLEGIKVVEEVLNKNKAINIMFIAYSKDILLCLNGGNEISEKIQEFSKKNKIELINLDKKVFEYVSDTVTPQGILAVIEIPKYNILDVLKNDFETGKNILILDKLQDSGNIGTIVRAADAFNVSTIICLEGTTDVYSPKVVRSTMGSILREKIMYLNKDEINDYLKKIKEIGYEIVGTYLNTDKYINEIDFNYRYAFVLGNEANGISSEIINICDKLIKIPMSGSAESLNVGIASGIILYEQFKNNKK
jgi:TrmH family RNA methyltransferase